MQPSYIEPKKRPRFFIFTIKLELSRGSNRFSTTIPFNAHGIFLQFFIPQMYLAAVDTTAPPDLSTPARGNDAAARAHDTEELRDQIRDMVDQMQELELVREEMALRLQQQAGQWGVLTT